MQLTRYPISTQCKLFTRSRSLAVSTRSIFLEAAHTSLQPVTKDSTVKLNEAKITEKNAPQKIKWKWKDNDKRLHFEILAYMNYIQASPSEKRTRLIALTVLRRRIEESFDAKVQVTLYGSVATGLELPTADLDLSLDSPERVLGKQVLRKLYCVVERNGLARNLEPRFGARVPVLRVTLSEALGSIGVDFTVNTRDGPKCVEAIKQYISDMPALRPLIFTLKSLLSYRNLNDAAKKGLSSYSLTCMCISFLQLNPKNRPKEYLETPFQTKSLGILLKDFLQYYAVEFPYAESYISVLQGRLLPKASVDWLRKRNPESLAIECLVKDRNDVARPTKHISSIRDAFESAAKTLSQASLKDKTVLGSIIPFKGLGARRPDVFSGIVVDSPPSPVSLSASMNRLRDKEEHKPRIVAQKRKKEDLKLQLKEPPTTAKSKSLDSTLPTPTPAVQENDI